MLFLLNIKLFIIDIQFKMIERFYSKDYNGKFIAVCDDLSLPFWDIEMDYENPNSYPFVCYFDEYGEEKEIKRGTKHFTGGTKVCLAPIQWGDGYERVVVIGIARKSRKYIEVVMQKKYIENFRMQKIYKPTIIRKMIDSEHSWWGDTDDDQKEIKEYLEEMGNQKSGSDTE